MRKLDFRIILACFAYQYQGNFEKIYQAIYTKELPDMKIIKQVEKMLREQQVKICCITDADYPKQLQTIINPPMVFFYEGDLKLVTKQPLLIIGDGTISKNQLKNLKNQVIISVDQPEHDQAWLKDLALQKNSLIKISNQPIEVVNNQADLVISFLSNQLGEIKLNRRAQNSNEKQNYNLALGLSAGGYAYFGMLKKALKDYLKMLQSQQDKSAIKIEDWKPYVKDGGQKKQILN